MKSLLYTSMLVILLVSCTDGNTSEKTEQDTSTITKDSLRTGTQSEENTSTEIPAPELNASERNVDFSKLDHLTAFKLTYGSAFINDKNELLYKYKGEGTESYDGYHHMKLDTLISFTSDSKEDLAIAIFSSLEYASKNETESSCHGCGAAIGIGLFKKENNTWIAKNTKPVLGNYGTWGQAPFIDVKIINGKCFVILNVGFSGQGYTEEVTKIIWVSPSFPISEERMLSIQSYSDNFGVVGSDSPESFNWHAHYDWKIVNGKLTLTVTYSGTESVDGKAKKKKGSEKYVLDEKKGMFVK